MTAKQCFNFAVVMSDSAMTTVKITEIKNWVIEGEWLLYSRKGNNIYNQCRVVCKYMMIWTRLKSKQASFSLPSYKLPFQVKEDAERGKMV